MRTLTIIVPDPGESGYFDVVDQAGRCCGGLCWDEMLGQVAVLTMPPDRLGHGYRMQTPQAWQAEREARMARQQADSPSIVNDT